MQVLIIEDEAPAANRLSRMLLEIDPAVKIAGRLDSVQSSVSYFQTQQSTDLIFMDIQLGDGISFDIFSQVTVKTPVIFVTAFDQYTLKAFKVNSIDYLLKPVEEAELKKALDKYKDIYQQKQNTDYSEKLLKAMQEMTARQYGERLLIRRGQQMSYLKTEAMAYCYADGKLCFAVDFDKNKLLLENNLSQLEEQLPPNKFFRINRHLLVNIDAIKKVHTWLGGRLKIELQPATDADTLVSRERVNNFKDWLGQ